MSTSLLAVTILLFIPVYALLLSMCSYIGKVWAMRLLFGNRRRRRVLHDDSSQDEG